MIARQPFQVRIDSLKKAQPRFVERGPDREATRNIRRGGANACLSYFKYDQKLLFHFIPACLRIAFKVPGGMSSFG